MHHIYQIAQKDRDLVQVSSSIQCVRSSDSHEIVELIVSSTQFTSIGGYAQCHFPVGWKTKCVHVSVYIHLFHCKVTYRPIKVVDL